MSKAALLRHDQELAQQEAAEAEEAREKDLRRQVREAIPKSVMAVAAKKHRPKGRPPLGGFSRREVADIRRMAEEFVGSPEGFARLEKAALVNCVVVLIIDGILGTEPWRAEGPHAGAIAANARVRYLENARQILADMRDHGLGAGVPKGLLSDGVIDAERTDGKDTPEPV